MGALVSLLEVFSGGEVGVFLVVFQEQTSLGKSLVVVVVYFRLIIVLLVVIDYFRAFLGVLLQNYPAHFGAFFAVGSRKRVGG